MNDWDVFVSYSRRDDAAQARTIADALIERGLRVFWDDHHVPPFQAISPTILSCLASSRVLLAYYSVGYPLRPACQHELTTAFLAGQREGDPTRRVLVVNPEPRTNHIHPIQLRESKPASAPRSQRALTELATRVAARVATVDTPIGAVDTLTAPLWLPAPVRPRPTNFPDRLGQLWELHSALRAHDAPMTAAHPWPVAVVVGPPGTGKSAFVAEYAHRFGSAFPDGIFWLDASDPSQLATHVTEVAAALTGTTVAVEDAANTVARRLHETGARALWIIDDVPADTDPATVRAWLGPHPLVRSVITTTDPAIGALGQRIDLRADTQPDHADSPETASSAERAISWKLQLELAHRIPTITTTGQLRSTLTSLYELARYLRGLLRETPPGLRNALNVAYSLLQYDLRPVLTYWHPVLQSYESHRDPLDPRGEPLAHERDWPRHQELATVLDALGQRLESTLADLSVITGSQYGIRTR